jgi:hypothetical protein
VLELGHVMTALAAVRAVPREGLTLKECAVRDRIELGCVRAFASLMAMLKVRNETTPHQSGSRASVAGRRRDSVKRVARRFPTPLSARPVRFFRGRPAGSLRIEYQRNTRTGATA